MPSVGCLNCCPFPCFSVGGNWCNERLQCGVLQKTPQLPCSFEEEVYLNIFKQIIVQQEWPTSMFFFVGTSTRECRGIGDEHMQCLNKSSTSMFLVGGGLVKWKGFAMELDQT